MRKFIGLFLIVLFVVVGCATYKVNQDFPQVLYLVQESGESPKEFYVRATAEKDKIEKEYWILDALILEPIKPDWLWSALVVYMWKGGRL